MLYRPRCCIPHPVLICFFCIDQTLLVFFDATGQDRFLNRPMGNTSTFGVSPLADQFRSFFNTFHPSTIIHYLRRLPAATGYLFFG